MNKNKLANKAQYYLNKFCIEIPERCVGSKGNRQASKFFNEQISKFGWQTETQEFDAIDWKGGGATLNCQNKEFNVLVSPYSLGVETIGTLVSIANVDILRDTDISDKIVLLHDDITKEQLMPKSFVFYNPEEHQEIISLLENGNPKAIICATGRNAALAGGVYPFPLIEDGDFDIPSVYMTEKEGHRLQPFIGKTASLKSISKRIPGKGFNIIARRGSNSKKRIVITAHIDAKKGTPGAIDNATGVAILLLLAELQHNYDNDTMLEIVAFNGEDYYAVPGQMLYVNENHNRFNEIILNINIDGAGYKNGNSALSFFKLPIDYNNAANKVINEFKGIEEGDQWVQGDHSIFIQQGCPAIAVSSKWFTENNADQDITHTPKDNLEIVDVDKVIEIAKALNRLLEYIT